MKAAAVMVTLVLGLVPVGASAAQVAEQATGARVPEGFADVVEHVSPSVVSIFSVRVEKGGGGLPFFHNHGDRRERGLGSGVIVSSDGFILTNSHVVEDATRVTVTLSDGRELDAQIVGVDPPTDLAVVKIDAKGLPVLSLGRSSRVRVGDFVLAIGAPFGLTQSVSMGIISAVGRGDIGIVDYEDFLQTDAAINPGNSGGPLVNTRGELIGISTALASAGGGNEGIGFAVPADLARSVMTQILEKGRVVRGYLGVSIQPLTPPLAEALGLTTTKGAVIGDVTEDGPAAKAGLHQGDVIVALDGAAVPGSRELRNTVSQMAPGTKIDLTVLRDGKRTTMPATLGELPTEKAEAAAKPSTDEQLTTKDLGLEVVPLDDQVRDRLKVPKGQKGVVVTEVKKDSAADEAGFHPGDVIEQVNRTAVSSPAEVEAQLKASLKNTKKPVLFLVSRGGSTQYVLVERD